jgi:hypothetical protein
MLAPRRAQLHQFVAGPAFLEGSGELQIFEFQKYLRTSDVRKDSRCDEGRSQQLPLQSRGGQFNIRFYLLSICGCPASPRQ